MSEKRKNCLLLAAVILLVAGLAVTGILLPDQQISLTERRSLAQLPTVSVSLVLDKSFSEAFDSYSQDQFPFREWFRRVRAWTNRLVFRLRDDNGIYIEDGYAAKSNIRWMRHRCSTRRPVFPMRMTSIWRIWEVRFMCRWCRTRDISWPGSTGHRPWMRKS